MTRMATTVDRLAALLAGFALIVVGVGFLIWDTDWISGIPQVITAPGLVTAAATNWWPWAVAVAGIVLVLTALRWLFIHTPKAKVKDLRLLAGDTGSVSVDLGEVADAAARRLGQSLDIHSAKGKAVIDRGTRTIDLAVVAQAPTTLSNVTDSIDAASRQIAGMLEDPTIATRTSIHIDKNLRRRDRIVT